MNFQAHITICHICGAMRLHPDQKKEFAAIGSGRYEITILSVTAKDCAAVCVPEHDGEESENTRRDEI